MKISLIALLVLPSLHVYSEELKSAYICTTKASTGFTYDEGKWKVEQFSEKDFLVRKFKESDPGFNADNQSPYGVFELDEAIPAMYCKVEKTLLLCEGLGQLEFLAGTGRFMRMDTFAYLSGEEDTVIHPRIMRGICKPLLHDYKEPPKKAHAPSY